MVYGRNNKNGCSHDVLADQIKYKLYERQAISEKLTILEIHCKMFKVI